MLVNARVKGILCLNLREGKEGIIPPSQTLNLPKITNTQNTTQHHNQQQPQNRIVIYNTLNKAM